MKIAIVLASWMLAGPAGAAARTEGTDCLRAIAAAEAGAALPPALLGAIAAVESGRADPATGRIQPWPWTINVAGTAHFYPTKAEAIAAVRRYRHAGDDAIDVGCMQISLRHHPAAFASLNEAFDPDANVAYAARFLRSLFQRAQTWPETVAAYHSLTPDLGAAYWGRVGAHWSLASRYAAGRPIAMQGSAADARAVANRMPQFAARVREAAEDHSRNLAAVREGARPAQANKVPGRFWARSRSIGRVIGMN